MMEFRTIEALNDWLDAALAGMETDEFVIAEVGIGLQFLQRNSSCVAFAAYAGTFAGRHIITESAGRQHPAEQVFVGPFLWVCSYARSNSSVRLRHFRWWPRQNASVLEKFLYEKELYNVLATEL
jgi:hypothetical protein